MTIFFQRTKVFLLAVWLSLPFLVQGQVIPSSSPTSSEAEKLLEKHLRKSTKERQAEWNANLTKSYLAFFSESELVSIANELKNSPYAEKFEGKRPVVDKYMREISTETLKSNLNEALKNTFTEFNNKDT